MLAKEDSARESKLGHALRALLDLPKRITEPSKSITDEGERRKARFLSVALFTGTCIYPILQITSDVTMGIPYYSVSAVLLAALYLLSRTDHVRLTSAISITFIGIFPFMVLLLNPLWNSLALAFQIFSWPVLAVLIGSQLLTKEKEAVLIAILNIGLLIVCLYHPGILFSDAIEFIGASFAIQTLIGIATWPTEYYSMKIEENNRTIEARRRELEIYTSLLRHDLANDIQMILGGLELSQMTLDEPKKHSSFLDSTLAAVERMKNLIHIFSVSQAELDNDLVSVLELICRRAEIAFKGMKVNLDIKDDVRDHKIFYGKLVAMVFENLLRNAAQHAGETPRVQITISATYNHLDIVFEDDGPGIPEEIRKQLFGKGVTTGSKGRGLGLYLTKTIIESEGGSIELVDTGRPGCCFHIRLPRTYSQKIQFE
ncbi:MAG: sensor histidine kinase [Candidatus Thorarchaeota archaeon]